MELTIADLVEAGIVKKSGLEYTNTIVECHATGGILGIWVDGVFLKAIQRTTGIYYNLGKNS